MADRYFTPKEANDALDEVRPLAERLVAERRLLLAATARRARLSGHIQGNGGGLVPSDVAELDLAVEEHRAALESCVGSLAALGVQVKDLDLGLVDFPSLRDGEEVLLCWKLGEEDVSHWHGVDEGFAGRKPLAADE